MSADNQKPGENRLVFPRLKGLNERDKFVNPEGGEFDVLKGWLHQTDGIIERANGILLLQALPGHRILSIYQTFDTRQTVLIQTDKGLYLYNEDEVMGRPSTANLTPVVLPEEEDMARALIFATAPSGVVGGGIPAAAWTTVTLNQLVEQINPDGSAAAFVISVAGNIVTLAPGTYRFKAVCSHSSNNAPLVKSRFCFAVGPVPVWLGLQNEESLSSKLIANDVAITTFAGSVTIGVNTGFLIQYWSSIITDVNGAGRPVTSGNPEVYRQLEILKTA